MAWPLCAFWIPDLWSRSSRSPGLRTGQPKAPGALPKASSPPHCTQPPGTRQPVLSGLSRTRLWRSLEADTPGSGRTCLLGPQAPLPLPTPPHRPPPRLWIMSRPAAVQLSASVYLLRSAGIWEPAEREMRNKCGAGLDRNSARPRSCGRRPRAPRQQGRSDQAAAPVQEEACWLSARPQLGTNTVGAGQACQGGSDPG